MNNEEISIEALRKELESGLEDYIEESVEDEPDAELQEKTEEKTEGKTEEKVAHIRPAEVVSETPVKDESLEMDDDTEITEEKLNRAIKLIEKNIKWTEKMANMIQKQAISQQSKAKALTVEQASMSKKLDKTKFWVLGTGVGLAVFLWVMFQMNI